jgi:hypothetical protein
VVVDLKIFEIEENGSLQVAWKDCYQMPWNRVFSVVHPGEMVVVMNTAEFLRFKLRYL